MSSPLPTRLNPSNMRTRIRYTILRREETEMHFDNFSFGCLRIDNSTYEHDVVIDRGEIRDRTKRPSKKFRDDLGTRHCPSRRTYPGNAANSSSVPVHTADCR